MLQPSTDHRDRVRHLHKENDISISKVTHAGRVYAAQTARSHGASESGTKALGGWNDSEGSFRQCYQRQLPVDALLGVAMFNGNKPESYSLPRGELGKLLLLWMPSAGVSWCSV